jgi:hypothetical protein
MAITEVGRTNNGSIRIEQISGRLSKETIQNMMHDAERWRHFADERETCTPLRNQKKNFKTKCLDDKPNKKMPKRADEI